jgi:hypothetical protein
MQAQDRLRNASGTCDGVIQAYRRGKLHAEHERLGVHMLVGNDVIAAQDLDGRVCHVVAADESHGE